ncbi:MAG TPA: phosphate ABC transporter substrate-binding protein PstS [Urbifossiella sp.]|jgi:phosphate transport system substrate-binding protein|nr:phosphate ABC transporter substrate-binding protein PstS [Urbifossiella sp.]
MFRRPLPAAAIVFAALAAVLAGTGCGSKDLTKVEINAEGATFVEPIMKVWTNEYLEKTGDRVRINYQGKGSGAGISQMTKKLAAFGCSDAPMNAAQLEEAGKAGGEVVHIPLVIGAVVPMYNLPGVEQPVRFTGPLLVEVFTGKVKRWDDPKLKALNPGVNLPGLDIQPVYRADPSGTSFIFSDYLAKIDPEFKKTVGVSTTPKWPETVGIRQQKSDGVAGHINRTAGAIGYIELTYALDQKEKAKFGSVRNAAGKDVLADLAGITAAAAASLDVKQTEPPYSLHELTYNLTNAPGDASYPIAGMSFAVLYQKGDLGDDAAKARAKAVVEFLTWATSNEGQELAGRRNYAPLPPTLREKAAARLRTVVVE